MSKNIDKIKSVIKAQDKRFWLMLFVVFSTLLVFIIWTLDVKNVFFEEKKIDKSDFDFAEMKKEVQLDVNKTLEEFSFLIEKKMEESGVNESAEIMDLRKVEDLINEKNKTEEIEVDDFPDSLEKSDLEKSDETVDNLKKRIEELERELEE
ncbi:MAG: hypothetical protein WC164_02385 [Patescibacteria group bacterium]|nr:hypothetical protein [Patescibacteria group bacterium]